MPILNYPHIAVGVDGVPIIEGTKTKVVEIVLDHLAHHWDTFEIRRQYPYLGLAQIHSALAYYYDNQAEVDQDIEQRRVKVADIRDRRSDSKVADKLSRRVPG